MNRQIGKGFLLGILMLLFASAVLASAETDFNKGVDLFSQGDYAAAVVLFKQAEEQGMSSVALHYNLASSYFKLEDYANSKHYFEQVAKSPDMRDLADFNLGLIAVKTGDNKQAKKYFTALIDNSNDEKIVALAKSQLRDMHEEAERWRAHVSANMGYDDNITALPSDAASNIDDSFYNLFASADVVVAGRRKNGWIANATYYRIDFSDTDLFDEYQYALGIRREAVLSGWDSRFHFDLSQKNFGGNDFQSVAKLDIAGNHALSKSEKLFLRYRYEDISSDNPIYDYLAGWRQRARIEYRHYSKTNIKQLYYELELNDRGELAASTYAYDYSPTRHTLSGKYTQIFSEQWQLSGELSYRVSDFPESASFDRNDDQLKFTLTADYSFDTTLKMKVSWLAVDNASSVDLYNYDKTMMTVGFSKLF